jgi:hypothetical protein
MHGCVELRGFDTGPLKSPPPSRSRKRPGS